MECGAVVIVNLNFQILHLDVAIIDPLGRAGIEQHEQPAGGVHVRDAQPVINLIRRDVGKNCILLGLRILGGGLVLRGLLILRARGRESDDQDRDQQAKRRRCEWREAGAEGMEVCEEGFDSGHRKGRVTDFREFQ